MLRTTLAALLLITLVAASGCSRHAQMVRARQLEQQGQPNQALEIYKAQYATTPEYQHARRADLQYHMGECLLAMGRTREAFSAYTRAVDIDDTHRLAHLRLGEMYLLSGAGENATEQAQAVLKDGGPNLDALALLGEAAAANGNLDIARSAFQTVLQKDPSRVKVALSLADILNRSGHSDAARDVLVKTAKAQPHSSAPWVALGRLEETLGHIKPAEEAYRTAVKVEDTPETNLRLAQYLQRTARVEEAKLVLAHVDALRPTFPTASADFALISDRFGDAREGYLAALNGLVTPGADGSKEDRPRTIARLIEADLAGQFSQTPNAVTHVTPVNLAQEHLDYFRRELDPATLNMLEAEIALANNDLAGATAHADTAVQLAPESSPALYISGLVKLRAGDANGARSAWENALDNDPDHIPSRLALARLSLEESDLKGALGYVVPAVRQEPGNYRALMMFGRVLLAQKDYASAQIIAGRASVIAPGAEGPDLLRGEVALAANDPGQALLAFQKAVILDPNSQEAVDGLARAYRQGHVTRPMLLNIEHIALQSPVSPTLLEITGRLFAERGWTEDAKRSLRECLSADPGHTPAALELAQLLAQSGNQDEAARYAVMVPGVSQVVQGVAAEEKGNSEEAIGHYEAALKAGDRSGVAANNLAWLYATRGTHLDRALFAAQRAVEMRPHEAGVLDTLGFVYLRRHQYSDAISILEHAREVARFTKANELPQIEEHLRAAYSSAGQPEMAKQIAVDHP